VPLDPHTPVLVGTGVATQRFDDPAEGREAVALMTAAAEAAGVDDLIRRAGVVFVPRGTWPYHDPGRTVAEAMGAANARTVVAELGVLQTTLIERACSLIAAGQVDVAVVVGGEAKWRELRGKVGGVVPSVTDDSARVPDEILKPEGIIVSGDEISARLVSAVSQYALIENARRAADGQSVASHLAEVASLWARFNQVAVDTPGAWNRRPMSAAEIATTGPRNKLLAWPYNKWHNSQWNVDQAACLVLASASAASGLDRDGWVFPHTIAWSDHMVPVSQRPEIHRSPGFRVAFEGLGVGIDEIAHLDLYSCFPIAVRTQQLELGIDPARQVTVTGGMTFGGGPLNNYVLQSTAAMASVLREDPGSLGLVTAISGLITKQGVTLWSTEPPPDGYRSHDATAAAADAQPPPVPTVAGASGPATVATYTVLEDGTAVIVATLPDGRRSIATAAGVDLTAEEWCGRPVVLDGNGGFAPA
jgi:acetyl-CoA C-acetyltransferase